MKPKLSGIEERARGPRPPDVTASRLTSTLSSAAAPKRSPSPLRSKPVDVPVFLPSHPLVALEMQRPELPHAGLKDENTHKAGHQPKAISRAFKSCTSYSDSTKYIPLQTAAPVTLSVGRVEALQAGSPVRSGNGESYPPLSPLAAESFIDNEVQDNQNREAQRGDLLEDPWGFPQTLRLRGGGARTEEPPDLPQKRATEDTQEVGFPGAQGSSLQERSKLCGICPSKSASSAPISLDFLVTKPTALPPPPVPSQHPNTITTTTSTGAFPPSQDAPHTMVGPSPECTPATLRPRGGPNGPYQRESTAQHPEQASAQPPCLPLQPNYLGSRVQTMLSPPLAQAGGTWQAPSPHQLAGGPSSDGWSAEMTSDLEALQSCHSYGALQVQSRTLSEASASTGLKAHSGALRPRSAEALGMSGMPRRSEMLHRAQVLHCNTPGLFPDFSSTSSSPLHNSQTLADTAQNQRAGVAFGGSQASHVSSESSPWMHPSSPKVTKAMPVHDLNLDWLLSPRKMSRTQVESLPTSAAEGTLTVSPTEPVTTGYLAQFNSTGQDNGTPVSNPNTPSSSAPTSRPISSGSSALTDIVSDSRQADSSSSGLQRWGDVANGFLTLQGLEGSGTSTALGEGGPGGLVGLGNLQAGRHCSTDSGGLQGAGSLLWNSTNSVESFLNPEGIPPARAKGGPLEDPVAAPPPPPNVDGQYGRVWGENRSASCCPAYSRSPKIFHDLETALEASELSKGSEVARRQEEGWEASASPNSPEEAYACDQEQVWDPSVSPNSPDGAHSEEHAWEPSGSPNSPEEAYACDQEQVWDPSVSPNSPDGAHSEEQVWDPSGSPNSPDGAHSEEHAWEAFEPLDGTDSTGSAAWAAAAPPGDCSTLHATLHASTMDSGISAAISREVSAAPQLLVQRFSSCYCPAKHGLHNAVPYLMLQALDNFCFEHHDSIRL
jgi:hypothetical protein